MTDAKTYTLNIPEEPPVGTKVRDNLGNVFEREAAGGQWFSINGSSTGRTWLQLLRSFGELTDVTPLRTFELPPEPPVGTKVRDRAGDIWTRDARSNQRGWTCRGGDIRTGWTEVMHYAPLTEVR